MAGGLATEQEHTVNRQRTRWTFERSLIHQEIVDELYAKANGVPNDRKAVIAGGLGGAGKSTVLSKYAGIDLSQYLVVNPDDIKEVLARRGLVPKVDGLSPMEASNLVHEESSHVAKQLAARALADGKNMIWDITMASRASTEGRIDSLRAAGYTHIEGVFVDIPVETSVERAGERHRRGHEDFRNSRGYGGRYVPPDVIRENRDAEWGSKNRRTFEELKDRFDGWKIYDNSMHGARPRRIGER